MDNLLGVYGCFRYGRRKIAQAELGSSTQHHLPSAAMRCSIPSVLPHLLNVLILRTGKVACSCRHELTTTNDQSHPCILYNKGGSRLGKTLETHAV